MLGQKKTLTNRAALIFATAVVAGVGLAFSSGPLRAATISLDQLSYSWDTDTDTNSSVGQVSVDNTGSSTGVFLNLASPTGWVVQNLYVPAGAVMDSEFDLGNANGTADTSLSVNTSLSGAPITTYAYNAGTAGTDSVGTMEYDAEGATNGGGGLTGTDPISGFAPTDTAGGVSFTAGGLLTVQYQSNQPNVQAADNQCVPASVANGLTWLKNTVGLGVTQPNNTGLGNIGGSQTSDGTLVGTLDVTMNRGVTSRTQGLGVSTKNMVTGTLTYLDNQNLTNVGVQYEGYFTPGNQSVTASGRTASGVSLASVVNYNSFNFIINSLQAGKAVQAWESWPTGAHSVEVTGAGYILGVPWIAFKSDLLQTPDDPTDTLGTGATNFSFLGSLNSTYGLRYLNEGGQPYLTFAMTEAVPEPASLALLVASGSLLLLVRRRVQA